MNCSFCGCEIPRGTETIYVTKRGKALYFCSGKCEINMLKLERKARETKWTKEYAEEKTIRIKSSSPAPAPKAQKKEEKMEAAPEPVKEDKKKEAPKKKAKPASKEAKKPAKKKK